jgi:hypothetical protein
LYVLTDFFEGEAFEIFRLGDHGDDRVIGALGVGGDAAEDVAGVVRGGEQRVLEQFGADVVRAAEGGEGAAGLQQLQRAQMDFFITAQGVVHRGAVAGEGGRIEDDEVETRDDAFVRFHGGGGLQPVEHVDGLEGAGLVHLVGFGVAFGGGDGIRALIEQVDVAGTGARGVQAEAAEEAEAIEDVATFRKGGHGLVVGLLVEIHAGLMAADEVGLKFQVVEVYGDFAVGFTGEQAVGFGEAFKFARGDIAAFHDGAGRKDFFQGGDDVGLAQIHAERGDLDDEDVLVFIDDEAAEEIALGIDDAEGGGAGQVAFADGEGGTDAFLKKFFVGADAVEREEADADLGFGIVKAGAEQALAVVLDLYEVAIGGGLGEAEDLVGVDPRMAGNDAVGFAWPEEDSRYRISACRHIRIASQAEAEGAS